MEKFEIKLNNHLVYDGALKGSLPEHGDIAIVTKDGAMESGAAAAMITFSVDLPDGTKQRVQTVTTVKLLLGALAALRGRYDDNGKARPSTGGKDITRNYG